jgi:hypothetical protein
MGRNDNSGTPGEGIMSRIISASRAVIVPSLLPHGAKYGGASGDTDLGSDPHVHAAG